MRTSRFLPTVIAVLIHLLLAQSALATTWYVDASVNESSDGTSWETAFKNIQEGIDAATDGDVVIVAPGTYAENVDLEEKEITLSSTDPQDESVAEVTILEGDGSGSVVTISAAEIRGFTITGGKAQDGGGIHCEGPAVIANNIISGNRASGRGGGIICSGSSAVVTDNKILNNWAKEGAGISCFSSTDVVTHNEISGNEASYGGAIHCFRSSAQVSSNTVKENTARGQGGAICCDWSSGTVIASNLIFRNSACGGATIRCLDADEAAGPTIINNTIAFNEGGGISASRCVPLIRDCVLWKNGSNLQGCAATFCCVDTGDPGEGNFGYHPLFADPAEEDFRLKTWSPCIDTGHPDAAFSNEPEPNGGRVNVGAYGNSAEAAVKCPDADQDGLPDGWEMKWFFDLHEGSEGDPDQDGIANRMEYLYGWDPTLPAPTIVESATKAEVYHTIQAAICESRDGDEIIVHPGRHEGHFGFAGKAVVLRSLDPTDSDIVAQTVIDGMGACSVALFCCGEGRESVLSGLTILGGRGVRGGGIYCSGSSPTIIGNVIADNSALLSGAAIYCGEESSPLIDGNTICGNMRAGPAFDPEAIHCHSSSPTISNNLIKANEGSGIRCEYGSSIIVGNTITEHLADRGGGILCFYSSPEIRGNVISHNVTSYRYPGYDGRGGGIYCKRSSPLIAENIICHNRSDYEGAAICCINSCPSILENTIAENTSEDGGAAVYCWDFCCGRISNNVIARNSGGGIKCRGHTAPEVANNTIVYNCLSGRGHGLYLRLVQQQPIALNCIIWGNGHDIYGVEPHYCCIQNCPSEFHNVGWYPYFVDPENGDYHLLPWSPCIDAGDATSDFSNEPQPDGGRVNIGAYGNTPEATAASPDSDSDGLPDSWEESWFGDLSEGGEDDADYDGIMNVTEYLFNSNPIAIPSPNRVQNLRTLTVYPTIGAAISDAEDGDELVVYPATYRENISFVGKGITLRSLAPEDPSIVASTVIEADLPQTVVRFTDGEDVDSLLAGLTITGGDAEVGGGIYCYEASPTIRNNVIRGNRADRGGGVCFRGHSSPLFTENEVIENAAREGGGIICLGPSTPVVEGNRVCSNHADEDGGGIYSHNLSALITGNIIQGNSAERNGGGIYGESESVSNNLIAGNRAGGEGGAVCAVGRETKLLNNTIVGNRASSVGGVTTSYYRFCASVTNCILWDNGEDAQRCYLSYCCVENLNTADEWGEDQGQGNFSLFPHFVNSGQGDYHLASWSPCIDVGDPRSDFSNEPQPNGGRINLGAYGNTSEATSKSFDRDGDDLPDDWEVRHFAGLSEIAFADPDQDGIFNIDEYLYGWDPGVAESIGVRNLVSGHTYSRIQDAIDKAQDGDEVVVSPGRYREQIDFLGKNITLRSLNPEDPATVASTVIDGDGMGIVASFVNGEGPEAVISGFTITGGGGEDRGGIYCEGSSPTITRNLITGNQPCEFAGGGIACCGGSPVIAFNTITKNRSCEAAGGIYCSGGCAAIVNNLIEDNEGDEGGISCWGGSPTIRGNVIRLNRAWRSGGGIRCDDSSALIENNVIAENRAGYNGGGIHCYGESSPKIVNNTIAGNIAIEGGAGICAQYDSAPVIENCIIWNRGTELVGCSASYSCVRGGGVGQGNISTFPYFLDPANGDYHLATWSPCIDAGDPYSPFRNEPQPNGHRINIGAYGNTPEATSQSLDIDSDGLPDTWEIAYFGGLDETPEGDADGDFIRNGAEYRFGWDPATPAARRIVNRTTDTWHEEIQIALYEAKEGAEIIVLPGTYHENLILPNFAISLSSIDPSDPPIVASTVISGDSVGSVITVTEGSDNEIRVCGFTIAGGKADHGGGIYCEGSSLTIENNVITRNSAQAAGAAIYCVDCSTRITRNTITSNKCAGGSGSGIYCRASSAFIAENTISGNSCMYSGAGIMCVSGSAVIQGNSILDNRTDDGGGIYCGSCSVVISGNDIRRNTSHDYGGAVYLDEAMATLAGNFISNNRAYDWGGGIYCSDSSVTVVNTTIANNWGNNSTGGVHSENSSVTIVNCILWGNAKELRGCSAAYSCIEDVGGENEGEGNIHIDPLFVDPAHGDFHLRAGSPCIGAGTNSAPDIPPTDIDGEYRPFGLLVDMGADEYVDQDQDLLPDYWEILNFANLWLGPEDDPDEDGLANTVELIHSTNPRSSDTDSDGSEDRTELLAGTDPLDPESLFHITGIQLEDVGIRIQWSSVPGKTYRIHFSDDLTTWCPLGQVLAAQDIALEAVLSDDQLGQSPFFKIEALE